MDRQIDLLIVDTSTYIYNMEKKHYSSSFIIMLDIQIWKRFESFQKFFKKSWNPLIPWFIPSLFLVVVSTDESPRLRAHQEPWAEESAVAWCGMGVSWCIYIIYIYIHKYLNIFVYTYIYNILIYIIFSYIYIYIYVYMYYTHHIQGNIHTYK